MTTETYTINRREGWEHLPPIKVEIDITDAPSDAVKIRRAVIEACLCGANLGGAYLGDADLRDANLRDADLGGAYLGGANLGGANLGGAYLGGANLGGANLRGANLGGANLRDANLVDANLVGANLVGANLGGANLGGADLGGANLVGANLGDDIVISSELDRDAITAVAREALATPDRLNMRTWHTCETTHCIAGWATHLAGERGKKLEEKFGPAIAGAILLGAPATEYFYTDNKAAAAWLATFLEPAA